MIEMKEYEILFDTGEARTLVEKVNHMTMEGWSVESISGMGFPTGIHGVYALMVRDVNKDKTMKILLIEDNPDHAHLIQEMLNEAGAERINVEWALLLSKGLERLTEEEFNLILLDCNLADSQGFSTISQVHKQAQGIPVVAMIDLEEEESVVEAMKKGYIKDYLTKPIISDKLIQTVKSFL